MLPAGHACAGGLGTGQTDSWQHQSRKDHQGFRHRHSCMCQQLWRVSAFPNTASCCVVHVGQAGQRAEANVTVYNHITTVPCVQVGDNSRPELMNKTSYHYGVWMKKATYGIDGVLIIPRYPTSVPYNAPNANVMMDVCAEHEFTVSVQGCLRLRLSTMACSPDY